AQAFSVRAGPGHRPHASRRRLGTDQTPARNPKWPNYGSNLDVDIGKMGQGPGLRPILGSQAARLSPPSWPSWSDTQPPGQFQPGQVQLRLGPGGIPPGPQQLQPGFLQFKWWSE